MTPQQRQLYFNQQDTVETLYTFHSDVFDRLTKEELDLLDTYYFMRRSIDVPDIADYAFHMLQTDPTMWKRAEAVLSKVLPIFGLDERSVHELLPSVNEQKG